MTYKLNLKHYGSLPNLEKSPIFYLDWNNNMSTTTLISHELEHTWFLYNCSSHKPSYLHPPHPPKKKETTFIDDILSPSNNELRLQYDT